jgi:phosphoribosylanthranilate isomerase
MVLPVLRLGRPEELDRLEAFSGLGGPLLIEPRVPGKLGGSGVPLALDLARAARRRLAQRTMFLAGGLTPETVVEAVREVGPDVVDVSSGVEQIPGVKDPVRLARFLEVLGWH